MMSAQEYRTSGKYSITNTTSSSDTYYSLTGSECGFLQNGTKVLMSKLGTYEEETLTCELPPSNHDSITLNPTTISSITRSGILESHFPVYFDSSDEKSSLLSHENSPSQKHVMQQRKAVRYSQGSGNSVVMRKKSCDDEFSGFTRNESLPLLSNLVEKSSPTNRYMRRKKIIYPIHTPPIINQSPKIIPVTNHSRSTPASISNLYIFNESNV
jgi:sn1-specific diacylglycerol lipase